MHRAFLMLLWVTTSVGGCAVGSEDPTPSCPHASGALPSATLDAAALRELRARVDHLIVLTQENRSFDHLFGTWAGEEADGIPASYRAFDRSDRPVAPHHLGSTCLEGDPPHQWEGMHAGWNHGAMDGFARNAAIGGSDGLYALGFYDEGDLPFYHWLARTYAIGDRAFSSVLSGTWTNRDVLYTGSSHGVLRTGERTVPEARTIFDLLDEHGVSWAVYTDGTPRQDCLGWTASHRGVGTSGDFFEALERGALPSVVFLDPGPDEDEHPAADVQLGEAWAATIYAALQWSSAWPRAALVHTYDESGGLFDHVPPPRECVASDEPEELGRLGVRVPLLVVSPWARPGYVSHEVHSTASVLRLVEARFDLPALTERDANADALLDFFDFASPPRLSPPTTPPASGVGGCAE